MLIGKKRWLRFRQYAVRVQFLNGPCRDIPPSVQFNVVTALSRFTEVSLPLLPNLKEIVWREWKPSTRVDMTVPLVQFFAGPKVASLSLFLKGWPQSAAVRAVLFGLPNTCPNVTSFTFTIRWPYLQPDTAARYIVDVARRWPHLQALQISPYCRLVMTQLASKPALTTLGIVIDCMNPVYCIGRLPDSIHTFSLEIYGSQNNLRCLDTLQGSPTNFHLRIIVPCSQGMGDFSRTLPTRLDNTRLHSLTIEATGYSCPCIQSWSWPTEPLLESLYAFSVLRALDLSSFCALALNDAAYAQMAMMWPELTSLKVGTTDMSEGRPAASVGAVIAVLRFCPHLQTLHIVFNGSIPPPPPVMVADGEEEEENVDMEGVEDKKEERAASQVNRWGVSNQHVTQIHVGYSPFWEGVDSLKDLASCLKSVMPRLETIRSKTDVAEPWGMVQNLLVGDDAPALRGQSA